MTDDAGAARHALRTLGAPRTWVRFARLANFFGYDGGGRDRPTCTGPVRMSPTVSVRNGSRVSIGKGSQIGQWCCLWAGDTHGRVEIGEYALLAPSVFVTASDYDVDAGDGPVMDLPKREANVRIGANTWLGAQVVVVAGVDIGDGSIIAAGSVVTRDIPPNSVAAGVPARVIRERGAARGGPPP